MPLPLLTDRLILRTFSLQDAEHFAAYRSDPEVALYQSWTAPYALEDAMAMITSMQLDKVGQPGAWRQVAIERKADGQLLGDCAFCVMANDPQQAEMGFTLARSAQGQGYAREAVARLLTFLFAELDLHRVVAICDVENNASIRLLERLGMRREAHHIEATWFKGRWSSEYVYAILRREWSARHSDGMGVK